MGPLRNFPRGFSTIILLSTLGSGPVRGSEPHASSDPIPSTRTGSSSPLGFTPRSRPGQLQAEAHALAVPTPENARKLLRILTAEPHVAGTPADYKTAVFVRDKLREWGWKADIAELEVLLNYPATGVPPQTRNRAAQSRRASRSMKPRSPPTRIRPAARPSVHFTATASRASAKGQVVYANFGRPEDFDGAREDGDRRQGQDRAGPLRRIFPRTEGPQRPETRGRRNPDLLRPGRRRIRQGRRLSATGRSAPARPSSAAASSSSRWDRAIRRRRSAHRSKERSGFRSIRSNGFTLIDGRTGDARQSHRWLNGKRQPDSSETTTSRRSPRFLSATKRPSEILKLLAGPNVPSGWQGGLPLAYHVGPGPAEVSMSVRHGLSASQDLERDRHDPRHGRARSLGHGRQPPRRLGLRRGRSGQRHGRDARDVPRPGRGREERLEAAANDRLRELGCRGIRPGRLDRVGRGTRQGDRRKGRAHAQRRLGRQRATSSR